VKARGKDKSEIYWGFGSVHSPVFWKLEKTTFRELDLFPSSGEGRGKTATLLGLLERVNFNQ
jgi:hypothetical protein